MPAFAFKLVLLCLILLFPAISRAQAESAREYFGHIATPCRTDAGCAELKAKVLALASCSEIDKPCPPANDVLLALFGSTYRPALPDYIVYFDQSAGRGKFRLHTPRLIFDGKNTPHLFGVRDIYAVVITEEKACIDALMTTEFKSEPNPFTAVFTALGNASQPAAAKPPARERVMPRWYPLSGDPKKKDQLWLGLMRASVEPNSINRMTVQFNQPKRNEDKESVKITVERKGGTEVRTETTTVEKAAQQADDDCSASTDNRYSTENFLATNAFFSNSPASHVAVSLALGITLDTRDTALSTGGSDQAFNGYATAKYYFLRPRLRAEPRYGEDSYRASLGVFLGTGIKKPFDELVIGLSVGHIWGNVGFIAGANSIAAKEDSTEGRKWRPFLGMDYSF